MNPPIDPRALRTHYRAFVRPDRVLLTGHSHQAWPDVARAATLESFDDAAEHVDDKWSRAFAAADAVRDALVARIGGARGEYALGQNTHELVARFLSALELTGPRRHLVTTAGEFHTIHRQLRRLGEAGVAVTFVPPAPVATLAERLAAAMRDETAAVLASTVLFETSAVVPGLAELAQRAGARGVRVLFDAYHAVGVVPFRVEDLGPDVFVVGGGYKYLQWGEGACFLRVPDSARALRPVYTGWFADFAHLAERRGEGEGQVAYGSDGAQRFAGSTYDPTSHYRARAVAGFFDAHALTPARLAASYQRQTTRLIDALAERHEVLTPRSAAARGGFVAVRVGNAGELVAALRERGVFVDARGDVLRLGPAPYTTDDELDAGARAFAALAVAPPTR